MDTTNQNTSTSPPLGGGRERRLILTRTHSNPSCTLGELTSSDGKLHLYTQEARLPADRESYIMFLLPPKTYKAYIDYGAISYKDKTVHAYWPTFKKVPWFPKAGFYTGTYYSPRMGRIELGTELVDDYHIGGGDEACQQLVRWAKAVNDANPDEDIEIEIVQNEDALIKSDVSWEEYQRQLLMEQEKAEQDATIKELYSPTRSAMPLS